MPRRTSIVVQCCSRRTYPIVLAQGPRAARAPLHIFLKFHLQCITSEGVPPSWHSMRPWPHLQFNFFRQWPISEGVFRSKTRHPTDHPFCCWLRLQSGFYALSFSFPWPNKYSVFFRFYSVNLAHLPFRLGRQEGVLIQHRINFPHLLFEPRTDRHLRGRPTQESQRIAHRSSGVTTAVEHPQPLNHYISFTLSV